MILSLRNLSIFLLPVYAYLMYVPISGMPYLQYLGVGGEFMF